MGEGAGLGLGLFSLRDFRPSCSTEGHIPVTDIFLLRLSLCTGKLLCFFF